MSGYIFANSFGDLGQLNSAEEGMRNHQFAQATSNLISSLSERRKAMENRYTLDREADYRDRSLALQNQERTWQHERDLGREKLGEKWLDLSNRQLNWQQRQPTPSEQRSNDMAYNRALYMAQQGEFEPNQHPNLSHEEAQAMMQMNGEAQKQRGAEYDVASRAADTLNEHEIAKRYVPKVAAAIQEGNQRWKPIGMEGPEMQYYRSQLQDWTGRLNDLAPKANRILTDKRISGLVTYDPDQDAYVPAVPAPRWRSQDNGSLSPANAQVPPQTGGTGTGSAPSQAGDQTSTATGGYTPKYHPLVYDRVNYWVGQGLDPVSAKRRALAEVSSVQ